jgi:hypothetical protein
MFRHTAISDYSRPIFKYTELMHYVHIMFACLSVCFINRAISYISIAIVISTLETASQI